MAKGFFRLTGAAALLQTFERAVRGARDPGEYWVGSAVFYGPFHEFGTTRMAARPHWAPAIRRMQARYELERDRETDAINAMVTQNRGLVKHIAFSLERDVKKVITSRHIIDTGNYRASIATGPTEGEAFDNSVARVRDESTVK